MRAHPEYLPAVLGACLRDLGHRWDLEWPDRVEVRAWVQDWPNSGCGSKENRAVLHSFWEAWTVVVRDIHTGAACVYHNGRFAFELKRPTQEFEELVAAQYLPGEAEDWQRLEAWREEG